MKEPMKCESKHKEIMERFEKEKWEFIIELSKKVSYFAGCGQYEENSSEMDAYKDGVSTALGMMQIDLGGTVKTKGMLQLFKEKALTEQLEELERWVEGEIKTINYPEGADYLTVEALKSVLSHIREQKEIINNK